MTRDEALKLMRAHTVEERQSNILVAVDLREEMPTFKASNRTTGERVIVDVRTYDERIHLLLEDK
jgi:hypothetical protein